MVVWDEQNDDLRGLSPAKRAERDALGRDKKAAEDVIEDRADFNAQMIMDDYNPDAMDKTIIRGKNAGSRRNFGTHGITRHNEKEIEEFLRLQAIFQNSFGTTFKEILDIASSLAEKFHKAIPTALRGAGPSVYHRDDHYIYDTAIVSLKTADMFDSESAEIHQKVEALRTIKCEETRKVEADKILSLAEKYQMRVHPETRKFVHDIERVQDVEERYNPRGHDACGGVVCVYRPKLQADAGTKGMKVSVADVYDQDPVELNASGDHLKGHTAPQNAPQLKHS